MGSVPRGRAALQFCILSKHVTQTALSLEMFLTLCVSGPCPPCPKMVSVSCLCGKAQPLPRRCSNKVSLTICRFTACCGCWRHAHRVLSLQAWSCQQPCGKLLLCKQHTCSQPCHTGTHTLSHTHTSCVKLH